MPDMEEGFALIEEILDEDAEHYGVKGMKWGRRKDRDTSPRDVSVEAKPGGRIKTKGGQNQPQSSDAIEAAVLKRVARSSTVDSLSNAQLKKLNERMNLEQNYSRLAAQDAQSRQGPVSKGATLVLGILANAGKQQLQQAVNQQAAAQVKELLDNK